MARPEADSIKFWNFLSIAVFRGFQGCEKLISLFPLFFLRSKVFVRVKTGYDLSNRGSTWIARLQLEVNAPQRLQVKVPLHL